MLLLYNISLLILIVAIILGIKNYKRLENLKIILLILILSLIQIFFSEIIFIIFYITNPNSIHYRTENAYLSTNIYTILEFCLILFFLDSISKNPQTRRIYIILFFIGIASYLTPILMNDYKSFLLLKYFSFMSGLIILITTLAQIKLLLKDYNTKNHLDPANLIMCIGIFLSNIILWPIITIQSLVEMDFKNLYSFFVNANSIGYIIMNLFSSVTFYGKNKL
jgi:hypothetical protein